SRVPRIAHVEPITKARSLMGPFDYLAPPGTEIGQLLVVPFGRRDVTGVVVGMADESEIDEERLAAPRDVLPQSVPPALVALPRAHRPARRAPRAPPPRRRRAPAAPGAHAGPARPRRGDRRRAARRPPAPARRHRLGQDRGLPPGGRRRPRAREGRDRPRPR